MRATQASKTAQWVAAARTFGHYLPRECQLCDDPYGVRFAAPWLAGLERTFRKHPRLGRSVLLRGGRATGLVFYMQLRTRFIDDEVRAFAALGGKQVVLLGAGFDCRALRLGQELPAVTFYEVDHPATQAVKRDVLTELAHANARFTPWDFERSPMRDLPAALGALGHEAQQPTLTLWEGVTMYLEPAAIEASTAAIASYSALGSPLVFTYFDKQRNLEHPSLRSRATARLTASVGEPFRFGWDPQELPSWLASRLFALRRDVDAVDLAATLFPAQHQRRVDHRGRHFAVAERAQ